MPDQPLTYGRYLKVPELLSLQQPKTDPAHHDEPLFIVIHQVYELWFKLVLHEVDTAVAHLQADRVWEANRLLRRVVEIQRLLVHQVRILETMRPQDFLGFRYNLNPASGFQSVQFRELEFLAGLKDERYVARFRGPTDAERDRLRRRLAEPSIWDAYLTLLAARGLAAGSDAEVLDSLVVVARDRDRYDDLWQLAEDLLTHDELAGLWRARHVARVERQIGTKSGTGGSTGAPYLRSRVPVRYSPLLWELRDIL